MAGRRNGVTIWELKWLMSSVNSTAVKIGDKYVPARPLGRTDIPHRLRALWLVLTDQADVVIWPEGQ